MHENSESFLECTYSDKQTQCERHLHNAYELIYIYEGSVRINIGESCYDKGPNTAIFISKLEQHNLQIIEGYYRRSFILLTPLQLDRAIDDPKLKSVFISRPKWFCHAFDLSENAAEAQALMSAIFKENINPGWFSKSVLFDLFELFIILCYRTRKEQFPLPSKKFTRAIYDVQKFIDSHFTEDIKLEELSARFYISSSYLSHAFREWTGCSPKQYIMKSRITYAKELLITTDLNVSEVAVRSGFGDTSNFIRSFKKETSETPKHYRTNNK